MAIEIRPTPTLNGTDADDFVQKLSKTTPKSIDYTEQISKATKILAKAQNV